MAVISVIIGSVRQGRFCEKPARWILDHLKKREGVDARLLDLKDYPMPFFDAPIPPAMPGRPAYEHEVVKRWTQAIAASDGFVIVTPEYNHGTSAVHVPAAAIYAHFQGQDITPHLVELDAVAEQTIDDLLWWTKALKTARAS